MTNNLAVEKTRMFQRIIYFVKELNHNRLPTNNPYKRLEEGKTLLGLALLEEAEEVVLKGINNAVATEELMAEVPLRELLRVIYKNMNDRSFTVAKTENEYLLEMAARKLTRLLAYTTINDRAYDYLRRYRVSDAEGVNKGMEELISRPEMKDINKANSQPAQERYFNTLNFYHTSKNEVEEALKAVLNIHKLWESNQARKDQHPGLYLSNLSNIIGKLSSLGKFEDSLEFIEKMEFLRVKGKRLEMQKFVYLELQYQLYYMNTGKLEAALKREDSINNGLRRFGNEVKDSFRLTLRYNLGITNLMCDNDRRALFDFNYIKNLGERMDRIDLQGVARLLRLVLLESQQDSVNFAHYLRNGKRFFTDSDRSYQLENTVYDWLQIQHKLVGISERRASYGHLSEAISDQVSKGVLGAEEIFIWATAKKRGVKTSKVFQESLQSK